MVPDLPPAGRVFIASMPPSTLAADLAEQARRLARTHGGRPVPAERIHLTLRFLGRFDPLERDWLAELAARMARIRAPACVLLLRRLGSFGRGRVHIGWIGPNATPAALAALVAGLDAVLAGLPGVGFDRRPYCPHVTLLRSAHTPLAGASPVRCWPIDELVLMVSRLDRPEYRPLARVPLTGPEAPDE